MGKVLVFCVRSEGQIHGLDDDKVYLKDVAKSVPRAKDYY